ncbi:MAG TPA: YigZ family protein [Actinomycetaceae bacterium]|nr:YigZ family protein [Actinomycetaceae bacterium]
MATMTEILTIAAGVVHRAELEIKRSRFITDLAHTDDEEAARDLIGAARAEFPDARHHCSAFIVGVPGANAIERSSDDGEPAGTAGKPMLDVLRGAGLCDVTAVVTRYFGGIKLGTGGLVRAYSDAVRLALETAPLVRLKTLQRFAVAIEHGEAGRVEAELRRAGYQIDEVTYGHEAEIAVVADDGEALVALIAHLTAGRVAAREAGTTVIEISTGGTTGD